ncbi:MAG: SsrA-binding protein [Planctomycetes bacterium DG_23]|nr:MAG: SsrA-binding protein [Planctomycetes bacterium DG_23]
MKIIARNRKARFNYHILETFEAGLALKGSEVKSLREGRASLAEGFARIEDGEITLYGLHIGPYSHLGHESQEPERPRRLLLHKREIKRLAGKVSEKGLTLIPLALYFNRRGFAKVELGLARGKTLYDKREAIKKRTAQREMERALAAKRKGG